MITTGSNGQKQPLNTILDSSLSTEKNDTSQVLIGPIKCRSAALLPQS
jgi:hypothetical protein